MPTVEVFSGYEDDIFLVKNSSGYYIPSFGVATLAEMCPGEAYSVFINGNEDIDFIYPESVFSSVHTSIESNHYQELTVTNNVKSIVKALKSGQIEIKNDPDGNIGASIGRKSFSDVKIKENYDSLL